MNFMRILFYLVIFSINIYAVSNAQLSNSGVPFSFRTLLKSDIDTKIMPAFKVQKLLDEDKIDEEDGLPYRFGAPFDVSYDLFNSGTWEELSDGSGLWRLKIISSNAFSINLLFDHFFLPEGAELFVYNEKHDMVLGAFTSRNNKDYDKFAIAPVKGDVIILEYYEPVEVRNSGYFSISRVVHAYKDIFNYAGINDGKDFGDAEECNVNVNCPEGEPWQKEKRGVILTLLSNGTRFCSASLINNVREDLTPYVLTADHCLGGEMYWIFMFNYESPGCEIADGPTYFTLQGSIHRASHEETDFALLELSEEPPDSFNVYFNGWSNVDNPFYTSTGIHHPTGDVTKINFDYDWSSSSGNPGLPGDDYWRIDRWEVGTVQMGSSGSVLFDSNHRIVGQLSGGESGCETDGFSLYGKLAHSWISGSPSTRLRDWLDPDNTGATVLDGLDPADDVYLIHTPMQDTYDAVNDYEIICKIKSYESLIADSLKLMYRISSEWQYDLLTETGNTDQYHAYIPAQPAGTGIEYYLFAWDIAGRADSTDIFIFNIMYSSAINVSPDSITCELLSEDSISFPIIIENNGQAQLDYNITYDFIPISTDNPPNKQAGLPDSFGYVWNDSDSPNGPDFNWVDISIVGTDIIFGMLDDNYTGPFDIGFNFPYYGTSYNQFYLGSNGIIGFDSAGMGSMTETRFPNINTPNNIIAWFWDDLDPSDYFNTGTAVYHYYDEDNCIIHFCGFPRKDAEPGEVIEAEIILNKNGDIKIQYLNFASGVSVYSCAVGTENSDGTDGMQIAFHEHYLHDSLTVLISRPFQWILLEKTEGTLMEMEADTIDGIIYSGSLDTGMYNLELKVNSNDPDPGDNPITIPVEMVVDNGSDYICGDANADSNVNILDITYLINFLYKDGLPPDPYQAANVDGSEEVNILDITYLISYLYKGGPDPEC